MIEATVIILFLFLFIVTDALLHKRGRPAVHPHLAGSASFEDRDVERLAHDVQAINDRQLDR